MSNPILKWAEIYYVVNDNSKSLKISVFWGTSGKVEES